jgi:NitT/TauT family transport system substrate-binding protein
MQASLDRWIRLVAASALLLAAYTPASAQLKLGHVATAEVAAAFAAAEEGYFKEAGLPVEFQLVPLNPSMPPALQSGSIHVATMTTTTFLQAVDGGLDLVIVAGGSMGSRTSRNFAVFARNDSGISKAQDFVGKKVGVPGVGAILHVWFRKWLVQAGADPRRVTFVESPFPQHPDLIRGASVDAVVTAEPILGRMLEAKLGHIVTPMVSDFAQPLPLFYYVSTRDYAKSNPEAIRKFRDSLKKGIAFAEANPGRTATYIAKYTRLPLEVASRIPLPQLILAADRGGLEETARMMREQGMLRTNTDLATLYAQ